MEEICSMKLDAENYLVFGAGASGLSVVEYCLAQNKKVRVIDTREVPPSAKQIKALLSSVYVSFGAIKQEWIEQADVIVLSPGVSPDISEVQKAKTKGAEVIGDIELFARNVTKPYIAITGSNGKSTVTMLARDILESQGLKAIACANIGEPALNVVNADADVFVMELSSFQLETCHSLSPLSSVVLNICDDHLDRHENIERYAEIKSTIYNNATHKILPRDESTLKYLGDPQSDASFGSNVPGESNYGIINDDTGRWLVCGERKIIQSSELTLLGEAGELNVMAALALTQTLIKDESKALDAVRNFKGLDHRCELVIEHDHVRWIDDSKGTNIGATVSAIAGLNQSLILIVGGVYKGGSLEDLRAAVRDKVSHVIVFGQDKQVFIDALNDCVDIKQADSLRECILQAHKLVKAGQAVLFSPACASFDMFANYIERGNVFKAEVHAMLNGAADA